MKEFIVISLDGYTQDKENRHKENMQVLDFIEAKSLKKARKIALVKDYGAYDDIRIYRIKRGKISHC